MSQMPSASETIRARVLIAGQVQRVGFRFSTCDMAALLHLAGWVRNRQDGRVEAVFEGPRVQVEEMLHWCQKGPPSAIVQNVEVAYEPPEGLKGFEVMRTQ